MTAPHECLRPLPHGSYLGGIRRAQNVIHNPLERLPTVAIRQEMNPIKHAVTSQCRPHLCIDQKQASCRRNLKDFGDRIVEMKPVRDARDIPVKLGCKSPTQKTTLLEMRVARMLKDANA